jgi:phosphoglycolate phosphatase-like HAD superfamily hydrolase
VIYALDFDGVVCDSIHECFENSYKAYLLTLDSSHLPKCPYKEWREAFYEQRGLVRPSRNFFLLWDLIINSKEIPSDTLGFEELALSSDKNSIRFDENLMRIRQDQILNSREDFFEQNKLFKQVAELWAFLPRPIYVVTAKDESITQQILDFNKLSVDKVFGKGSGPKYKTLLSLAIESRVSPAKIKFVDDNPLFVSEAKASGIDSALALWGYGPYTSELDGSLKDFKEVLDFFNNEFTVRD